MSNKFKDVMLDIETLGVNPGAVVLRISAVQFDMETGETDLEFDSGISLESSLKAGLVIEASTLKWWMSQSETARELAFNSDIDIHDALHKFRVFIDFIGPDIRVWGNGVRFDVGLLEALYKKVGETLPFTGYNERDVRTLVSFCPEIKANMKFEKGERHVAIDDCKHQIRYCSAIWNTMNGRSVQTAL